MKHEEEIEEMFEELVEKLKEGLPDYGKYLAIDGKAIETHAKGKKRGEEGIGDRGYDDGKLIEKLWDKYGMG